MVRISSSVTRRKRHHRVLKRAKGQFAHRSRRYVQAKRSLIKGDVYAYRDRKVKKRLSRQLWIVRLNAACRQLGISYSRFINGLKAAGVGLDRKVLSNLAIQSPQAFEKLVEMAKQAK